VSGGGCPGAGRRLVSGGAVARRMRILFVAAEAMEFRGVLRRTSGVRPAPVAVVWARTGRLGLHDVLLAANGAGWKRAAAAAEAGIAFFAPDAVVSTGFCGALDEKLEVGDIVLAGEVVVFGGGGASIRAAGVKARPATGAICSTDHVVQTAAEKSRLAASGACAVEMEAAGVAECAQAAGLPFYCVRAVTDLRGEDMANNFNTALRGDGHFDTIILFREALRHPCARIPELFRLGIRCARASRSLGDFFADCGF
jgi:adenosylhomocysteine nucleosidase